MLLECPYCHELTALPDGEGYCDGCGVWIPFNFQDEDEDDN